MKQTAVEWLVDKLMPKVLTAEQYYHIEQAKEMEKQQHGKTWDEAIDEDSRYNTFEQYYNETFKSEKIIKKLINEENNKKCD